MDANRFDQLTRYLSAPGTRRGLLHRLAALPLAGALAALLDEEVAAAGRRKRRKKRHKHQVGDGKDNRKGKRKGQEKGEAKKKTTAPPPACQPDSKAQTCNGQCATVTDNCGTQVDCGPCTCATGCHPVCQTCNPATGLCDPTANDTPCDDGNACTETDTCQNGSCVGSTPVVCPTPDQCHDPGVCDPASGDCSNPEKADDTPCDDGNACTQTDRCQDGVCVGSNPVVCPPAPNECQDPGICDPATGQCVYPNKAAGASCAGVACGQCDGAGICTSRCNAATQDCVNGSCATRCSSGCSCGACLPILNAPSGTAYCVILGSTCCHDAPHTCGSGEVCVAFRCGPLDLAGRCDVLCTPT